MIIQYMDRTVLAYLHSMLNNVSGRDKSKQKKIVSLFAEDTNKGLLDFLREERRTEPLLDSRFDCANISLDPNQVGKSEIQNVLSIRKALGGISPAVASNEKVWAGLCIGACWSYVRARWGIGKDSSAGEIATHFLYGFGARRSLTRNALARLWWIGQLTIDEGNAEDKYRTTRFVLEDTDYVVSLLERNTSDNPVIVNEIVGGVLAARAEGYTVERNEIRELAKYVNIVGGVDVLDLVPAGSIKERVLTRARSICAKKDSAQSV